MSPAPTAIYLDHQATTPVDPRVLDAMLPWFSETFGNAHSEQHVWGRQAAEAVDVAREAGQQVAPPRALARRPLRRELGVLRVVRRVRRPAAHRRGVEGVHHAPPQEGGAGVRAARHEQRRQHRRRHLRPLRRER